MVHVVATTLSSDLPAPRKGMYDVVVTPEPRVTMDDFMAEFRLLFEMPTPRETLLELSSRMQQQYKQQLMQPNVPCMLPSYNHTLPTGAERGVHLALDVGGSTFRVALVQLNGQERGSESMQIVKMMAFPITSSVKGLEGEAFFDWMAEKIGEMLAWPDLKSYCGNGVIPMGLAWSFPIIETSVRGGTLAPMGKGFEAVRGCEGRDLSALIMDSCHKRGLNVSLEAVVNDSAATLLSRAYRDSATRIALILGTGVNAAIQLPTTALAPAKFGQRPQTWFDQATRVLINTEMSMFGKDVLPTTMWDRKLNAEHGLPDFQPLEYLIGGRYIGEIVRLVVVDAVQDADLFSGQLPKGLETPYNFDCSFMAILEADEAATLSTSAAALHKAHPLPNGYTYQPRDLRHLRHICQLVAQRAVVYLAVGVHALWSLRLAEERLDPDAEDHVTIGCNGSVIEKYPGFRARTQAHLDELYALSGGTRRGIVLDVAVESAIYGAAVAVCCLRGAEEPSTPP